MEGQIPCTASQRAWSLEHNARICHSHDSSFITHKTHIAKHNKTIPHHHQSFGWACTRCCSVPSHCASFCWGSAGSIPQPHLTQMEPALQDWPNTPKTTHHGSFRNQEKHHDATCNLDDLKFAGDPHHLLVRNPTVNNNTVLPSGFYSPCFFL